MMLFCISCNSFFLRAWTTLALLHDWGTYCSHLKMSTSWHRCVKRSWTNTQRSLHKKVRYISKVLCLNHETILFHKLSYYIFICHSVTMVNYRTQLALMMHTIFNIFLQRAKLINQVKYSSWISLYSFMTLVYTLPGINLNQVKKQNKKQQTLKYTQNWVKCVFFSYPLDSLDAFRTCIVWEFMQEIKT